MKYIDDLLKAKGYKLTYTRRLIVKMFLEHPDIHFSPQEVYEHLKQEGSDIGIATVYRSIKILKDNDIIEQVVFKDKSVYELKVFGQKSVHAHFTCHTCDELVDYENVELSSKILSTIVNIEKRHGFKVKHVDVLLNGECEQCQGNKK